VLLQEGLTVQQVIDTVQIKSHNASAAMRKMHRFMVNIETVYIFNRSFESAKSGQKHGFNRKNAALNAGRF
jgi:hypothetical protein